MAEVGIFVGTMYGNALLVAEEAQTILGEQGHSATVFEDPEPADWDAYKDKYALVVTSTTGQGDLPDSIVPLFQYIRDKIGYQPALRYCVLPWATAPIQISAVAENSLTRYCRNKVRSAWETFC